MIPRCTWAARQLELLHPIAFLVPVLSVPALSSVESCRDLSSSSTSTHDGRSHRYTKRTAAASNTISEVLAVLQGQLGDVASTTTSDSHPPSTRHPLSSRPSTSPLYSSRKRTMTPHSGARASSTSAFAAQNTFRDSKKKLGPDGTKGKGVQPSDALEAEDRGGDAGIIEDDHWKPPRTAEPWPLVRLPPLPSPSSPSVNTPPTPPPADTSSPIPFEPPLSTPSDPSTHHPPEPEWDLDLSTPPADRVQLLRLLRSIPHSATEPQLLSLRHLVFKMGHLDDTGVIKHFVEGCIGAEVYRVGLRLLKESTKLMVRAGKSRKEVVWVFESPLKKLVRRDRWDWIVSYSDAAISVGAVSVVILDLRIKALYESKRYREVVQDFALFRDYDLEPSHSSYDNLAGSHLRNGNLGRSQEVLLAKYEKGYGTTVATCLFLLDGMWMYGGNRALEDKILNDPVGSTILESRKAIRQDPRILNRIISVRAARGHVAAAFDVLFTHFQHSSRHPLAIPQIVHRRSAGVPSHVATSPTTAPHWRPKPDIATFAILIGISLRHQRVQSALSLFIQSQEFGLGQNEQLIAAYVRTLVVCAGGDPTIACDFAFALPGGEAKIFHSELVCGAFEPTPLVWEVLFEATLHHRGLEGACDLLNRLTRSGRRLEDVTEGMVTALVEYLARTGDDIQTLKRGKTNVANLIVKVQSLTNGLRKPTIRNLNSLLELAWRRQRFQSLLRRKPKPVRPRQAASDRPGSLSSDLHPSLNPTPIASLPVPPFPTAMSRITRSITSRDLAPDRVTVQRALRSTPATESIDAMWEYLQTQLIDKSIIPTHHHFTIIMRAYLRLGDIPGARSTIDRAKEMGIPPHPSMYSVLLGGASRLGRMDEARRAYRDLKTAELEPDRQLYAALALSFARLRDAEGVESIIAEATAKLEPPLSPIDPVFVAVQYRAFVASGRLYQAQLFMRKKLAAGLVPDLVVLLILKRTKKWLNRKMNLATRGLPNPPILTKTVRVHAANLKETRARLVKANRPLNEKSLQKLEGLLALHAATVRGRKLGSKKGVVSGGKVVASEGKAVVSAGEEVAHGESSTVI